MATQIPTAVQSDGTKLTFSDVPDEHYEKFKAYTKTPEGQRPITVAFFNWVLAAIGHDTKRFVDFKLKALEARIRELEQRPKAMSYRGIWSEREKYVEGDFTTSGGSVWACRSDNIGMRPGNGSGPWTLACKSGRDGRDGKDAA